MLVWERLLQRGDLFIDVGANVGIYAVFCASLGAQVIALEPAPDTVQLLRDNIALNPHLLIEVLQAAAGERTGYTTLTSGLDSTNRIDPAGRDVVRLLTLDEMIGRRTVAGVKIDVEGFELDVLQGAHQALQENRVQVLQLEWNDLVERQPIAEFLSQHGYELRSPTEQGLLGPLSPSQSGDNVFAVPDYRSAHWT